MIATDNTISPISMLSPAGQADVKPLLSPGEKKFLDLLAEIISDDLIKTSPEAR